MTRRRRKEGVQGGGEGGQVQICILPVRELKRSSEEEHLAQKTRAEFWPQVGRIAYSGCVSPACHCGGVDRGRGDRVKTVASFLWSAWNTDKKSQVWRMWADLDGSKNIWSIILTRCRGERAMMFSPVCVLAKYRWMDFTTLVKQSLKLYSTYNRSWSGNVAKTQWG